jgi:hypothetical protein
VFQGVPYNVNLGSSNKLCPRCIIRFFNQFLTSPFIPDGSKISRSVNVMGKMEFKDGNCFIWDPKELNLTRKYGRETYLDVEIEGGMDGDLPLQREDNGLHSLGLIPLVFIKDGDVIWICKEVHMGEWSLSTETDGMLGSETLYHHNIYHKIKVRMIMKHITFKLAEQAQQEVSRRSAQRALADLHNARNIINPHIGERVNISGHLPRVTSTLGNHDFSTPYYDRDGRILVNCSCGYQRRMHIPRNGLITHQGLMVVVPEFMSVPGSHCTYDLGDHHITIRSSVNRREDLADLR